MPRRKPKLKPVISFVDVGSRPKVDAIDLVNVFILRDPKTAEKLIEELDGVFNHYGIRFRIEEEK